MLSSEVKYPKSKKEKDRFNPKSTVQDKINVRLKGLNLVFVIPKSITLNVIRIKMNPKEYIKGSVNEG